MAFRYIFVISAFIVLAQGSDISLVDQESEVEVQSYGGVPSGGPVAGVPRPRPAAPQPQRPIPGHGSPSGPVGGSQRPRPQVGVPRKPAGGAYRPSPGGNRPSGGVSRPSGGVSRPSGGAHGGRPIGGGAGQGNPHQNRNQKPY